MLKNTVLFGVVLCCFVCCASERQALLLDEHYRLSVCEKIKRVLSDKTSLWVMVVYQGKRYTALYDVSEETNRCVWNAPLQGRVKMIMPVMDALQNEALAGYTQRFFKNMAGLPLEVQVADDSGLAQFYKRCDFFSQVTREFFVHSCARLHKKGKVTRDLFGYFMTEEVLRCLSPSGGKRLRFFIKDAEEAADAIVAKKPSDNIKVFMPLPSVGVVAGFLETSCFWRPKIEETHLTQKNLLCKKMQTMSQEMAKFYPYCPEQWKSCLNYEEGLLAEEALRSSDSCS